MSNGDHGGRWLTYRELAEATGLSLPAAEARAHRHVRAGKWRRRQDNERPKAVRVLVPTAELEAIRREAQRVTLQDAQPLAHEVTRPVARGSRKDNAGPVVEALQAALRERDSTIAELRGEVAQLRQTLTLQDGELVGQQEVMRRTDQAAEESRQREAATAAEVARLRADLQQAQGRAERNEGELSGSREAVRIAEALAEREGAARQVAEAKLAETRHLLGQAEGAAAALQHVAKFAEAARQEAAERAREVEVLQRRVAEEEARAQAATTAAAATEQAARDEYSAATATLRLRVKEAEHRAAQAEARAALHGVKAKQGEVPAKPEPDGGEGAIAAARPRQISLLRRLFGRR